MEVNKFSEEKTGELLVFSQVFLAALTPILIKGSQGFLPPLFFAGVSMIVARVSLLIVLIVTKKTPHNV
jgi:hypothetical protein